MTIALALKVHDGLVVAADSATTLTSTDASGEASVVNVFNHANKIVNLHKSLPVTLMTWGRGNIGQQSIATLAKDLRRRFQGISGLNEWRVDPSNYKVEDIAQLVSRFFQEELAEPGNVAPGGSSTMGLFVGGFSAGSRQSESFVIGANGGTCDSPIPVLEQEAGAQWWGQTEAITRLLLGFSAATEAALVNLGVPSTEAPGYVEALKAQVSTPIISAPMPIQDAIDLAEFLVDTTIKFTRFSPGADTVGGPIEIAAITRHEGFKWVRRKHYYDASINPEEVASG